MGRIEDKTRGGVFSVCGWQRHLIVIQAAMVLQQNAALGFRLGCPLPRSPLRSVLVIDIPTLIGGVKPFLGTGQGKVLIKLINITSYPL